MAQSTAVKRVKSPPLPEVIDQSKPWVVREATMGLPALDYKSGVVTVPLSPSEEDRVTRNREMLRLKFSPKAFPKLPADVDPAIYQACETSRVDYRGNRLGVVHDTSTLTDEMLEASSKTWAENPQVAAALMLQHSMTGDGMEPVYSDRNRWGADYSPDESRIWLKLDKMADDGVISHRDKERIIRSANAAKKLVNRNSAPGPKQAIKAAQLITSRLAPPPDPPKDATGDGKTGPDGGEVAKAVKQGVESMAEMHGTDFEESIDKAIEKAEYRHGEKPGEVVFPEAKWGEMITKRPPRPLLFPARLKSKKWRPTDMGAVFRYPQRWLADQTGFAYRGQKEGGCTMLIDVSGSMSLSPEDILTVMTYMPASLIATYSGSGHIGHLTIVAEKGRRCEEREFRKGGGGNVIDAPALRWLAQQKGPRYWVSDGYVVGIGGHTAELYAECIHICRRNHIMRVDSMEEVIRRFEKYGKRT